MLVPILVALLSARAVQQDGLTPGNDTAIRTLPARVLRDAEHLANRKPLIAIAAGGAMAALAYPADRTIVNRFTPEATVEESLDPGSVAGNFAAQGGTAIAVYAIGLVSHHHGLAELGSELVEAQALNGILTETVKVSVNRTRPNGGHLSFPSGHTSASFATADVFEQRFGWKIGLLAYAGATYVSLSRLGEHAHYPSDTLFGAALGIASARSVGARHRALSVRGFAIVPVAGEGGAAILVSR
jgi:membrane-associated phospholipid phosphatase